MAGTIERPARIAPLRWRPPDGSYSYRVRGQSNEQLLAGLTRGLSELGLATGDQGFNFDFHAIRHHGTDTPLENTAFPAAHNAPARC